MPPGLMPVRACLVGTLAQTDTAVGWRGYVLASHYDSCHMIGDAGTDTDHFPYGEETSRSCGWPRDPPKKNARMIRVENVGTNTRLAH